MKIQTSIYFTTLGIQIFIQNLVIPNSSGIFVRPYLEQIFEIYSKIMFTMATQIEQLGKMVDNKLELAKRPEVVIRAIVPIVRAHFKNFTQIDIQLPDKTEYRFQALRNTNMVKHYVAVRLSTNYYIY
jgi:uncharacterized Fe-S cluster-containing radical SAM superfamily protein